MLVDLESIRHEVPMEIYGYFNVFLNVIFHVCICIYVKG